MLAVLFTFRFWEISDYSNRGELRNWLHKYVSDGWWRRGGINIAQVTVECYLFLVAIAWLLFATAKQFKNSEWIPHTDIIGTAFLLGISVTAIVWLLGYLGIRMTETTFLRYVSQNVSYTSQIILKRAVKSKIELGFLLMTVTYMPALYTLIQAVIGEIVSLIAKKFGSCILFWLNSHNGLEWIVSSKLPERFQLLCALLLHGFPAISRQGCIPFKLSIVVLLITGTTFPFTWQEKYTIVIHTILIPTFSSEFYIDTNILQCDSYLGVSVFLLSVVLLTILIIGAFYSFYTSIHLVSTEFQVQLKMSITKIVLF